SKTEVDERTDFRETIYWNPVVSTDENGKAEVEFYNSDASTTFRAIAEGLGYNGNAGRIETTYATQNALSLDAKIPPYLTVGDKAMLPVVIKNNRDEDMKISLNVAVPNEMKMGNYVSDLLLKPDSSQQILIPVEALRALKGKIEIAAVCNGAKEKIVLPIVASEKGFPVNLTFAGNRSNQYQFNINKAIPGTINANLRVFKDLEGQLLDGIESMLREPYGCFEQTSSTTYPNVYVLKYLRAAGKSNPAIEAKALEYIERGYKRLAGYETKENGFEWFGNIPPHEGLTAYGLLEFTDMQEFIKVDQKMLERTKKFLLDRRDGNGGFKQSAGTHTFTSVPAKIANVYIVYSLTQAGIGKEIQKEYEAMVKQALQSNDGYQLSMMALAASNMKNMKDYNALMSAANDHYSKEKMKAETSVANSRGASLNVETLSLYAMALMRQPQCEAGSISPIISSILGAKSYYGFGSTQGTVLALQAIVEYSKLTQKIDINTEMLFTLNNSKADNSNTVNTKLVEGDNSFAIEYTKQNSVGIPYSLDVAYNTFTPPNSQKAELKLNTRILNTRPKIGETTRMEIEVTNDKNMLQAMSIAKIGIPAGLAAQPWQLKEIMEKNQVTYYEIFDNYLVFYWMGFANKETKKINLDLKAEIAGTYKAKASNTYLYYMPEHKHWNDGIEVEVRP
ncbi:MAG TPA: alpha-2-macroglobulin family protein, partial [Chitinophagaceae bacterium]|nr:alpha-2-macroglobulin family protein [Chitinophagaceae bacterium]